MLYRLNEYIRVGEERLEMDSVQELKQVSPKAIALLLAKGRISAIRLPPLAVLPDWEEKAEKYAERGIESFQDLVDSAPSLLSEEGLDVEADIEDAVKWVDPEYDTPGATPVFGFTDVYELKDDDDESVDEA